MEACLLSRVSNEGFDNTCEFVFVINASKFAANVDKPHVPPAFVNATFAAPDPASTDVICARDPRLITEPLALDVDHLTPSLESSEVLISRTKPSIKICLAGLSINSKIALFTRDNIFLSLGL